MLHVTFRSVLALYGANLISTGLTMLATLLVLRWTPPHQLGIWNLMTVFLTYSSVLQLGVFNGMNRQIPFYRGQEKPELAERAARVGWMWCKQLTYSTLVLGGIATLYFLLFGTRDQWTTSLAFVLVLGSSWILQYLAVSYTVAGMFGPFARKSTMAAMFGVPLAFLSSAFGYVGYLARVVLVSLFNCALLYRQRPLQVAAAFDREMFFRLMRIGIPVWVLGQLGAMFMTLDRIVLSDSMEMLGYYVIAAQFAAVAVMVPNAFNSVIYPLMLHEFGLTGSAMNLWLSASRACLGILLASVGFSAICWVFVPPFVTLFLPAYSPGIEAARWSSMAGIALCCSAYGNVLNVLGRQELYVVSAAGGVVVFFLCWRLLSSSLGVSPLVAAAQSMLLGTMITSVGTAILCRGICRVHDSLKQTNVGAGAS